MSLDPAVMRIARAVARGEVEGGASAVILTGSHARGDARAHSDIDLVTIHGRQPADHGAVFMRGGHMVTIARTTPAHVRADFRDPARFTTYVPGWREAIILTEKDGVASKLQSLATAWDWADIADEWVAEQITGWAEEVLKLAAALDDGRLLHAATQRSLLAIQLAGVMAVRHRILSGTENNLWDVVSRAMGEPWASTQARALGTQGESVEASGRAALELYAIAVREVRPLLDRSQRAVVTHACASAGQSPPG